MPSRSFPLPSFLLLALVAVGCAATADRRKRSTLRLQVDDDSALRAPVVEAARQWSLAIGSPITVSADGDVPVFYVPELSDADCGSNALGCGYRGKDARIEILSTIPAAQLSRILLHEIGHQLRGEAGHVADPAAIMADPIRGSVVTSSDVEFICERYECGAGVT